MRAPKEPQARERRTPRNCPDPKLFRDRRAEGYVRTCVILICVCLFFSAVLFFAEALSVADDLKKEIKLMLDGAVVSEAVSGYLSLTDGSDRYTGEAAVSMKRSFEERFGDSPSSDGFYPVGRDGSGREISLPAVTLDVGERVRLRASFVLKIPVCLGSLRILTLELPLTVRSRYYAKFS